MLDVNGADWNAVKKSRSEVDEERFRLQKELVGIEAHNRIWDQFFFFFYW